MKCIYCGYPESKVVDSRPLEDGSATRRRRECLKCQRRFTTYEKAEQTPMMVIKKDGSREAFDVDKVRYGMIKACEKRNVSMDTIDEMTNKIEKAVYDFEGHEVSSEIIGNMVMDVLKTTDKVAYVRFASVYREFKDVGTFMDELKKLVEDHGLH